MSSHLRRRGQWTVVPEQLMKNDVEHKAAIPVTLTSRRRFMSAAVAMGGASILSAELGVLSAPGNAEAAAQTAPPQEVKLKDAKAFTLIGTNVPRLDSAAKSTGTEPFAGMLRCRFVSDAFAVESS